MKHLSSRGFALLLSISAAFVATVIPIIAGGYVSERAAQRREHAQIEKFADAAVQRVQIVAEQAFTAVVEMSQFHGQVCSPEHLAMLRAVSAGYRYLHDAGAYGPGHFLCSALLGSVTEQSIAMPAPEWKTKEGFEVWFDVPNPVGGDVKLVLIGKSGNYVSMNEDSFVDAIDLRMRPLAAVNTTDGKVFATSPGIDRTRVAAALAEAEEGGDSQTKNLFVKKADILPLALVVEQPESRALGDWAAYFSAWMLSAVAIGLCFGAVVLRLLSRSMSLHGDLERAVRKKKLEVHFQPIVELDTGHCVGAEALVRWEQNKKYVPPDQFIQLAETSPLIEQITDQVLEMVVVQLEPLFTANPAFYVSLNLSARDLNTSRFLNVLQTRLVGTGIRPSQIRLEVTEREVVDADSCRQVISAFRRAGFAVYIDDFGTGYSSLSYLQSFELDVLKIDKSFIDKLGQRAAASDVTTHIVAMARALKLEVVAEGIELPEQVARLKELGVRYGQGWLFSKALPAVDFQAFFKQHVRRESLGSDVELLQR